MFQSMTSDLIISNNTDDISTLMALQAPFIKCKRNSLTPSTCPPPPSIHSWAPHVSNSSSPRLDSVQLPSTFAWTRFLQFSEVCRRCCEIPVPSNEPTKTSPKGVRSGECGGPSLSATTLLSKNSWSLSLLSIDGEGHSPGPTTRLKVPQTDGWKLAARTGKLLLTLPKVNFISKKKTVPLSLIQTVSFAQLYFPKLKGGGFPCGELGH